MISHSFWIPIKQPVFHGKQGRVLYFFAAQVCFRRFRRRFPVVSQDVLVAYAACCRCCRTFLLEKVAGAEAARSSEWFVGTC